MSYARSSFFGKNPIQAGNCTVPSPPGPPGGEGDHPAPGRSGGHVLHHRQLDLRPGQIAVVQRGHHSRAQEPTCHGGCAACGAPVPSDGWHRAQGAYRASRADPEARNKHEHQHCDDSGTHQPSPPAVGRA